MERIEVPLDRWRLVGMCLGALAFMGIGLFLIRVPTRQGVWAQVVGGIAALFFGAVGLSMLIRLLRAGPALVIDDDGIVDDASGVGLGRIGWHEVGKIGEYEVGGQSFLGIEARDVEALIARQPFWKRRLVRANLQQGAAVVNIPQAALRIDLRDLRRELERRRGSSRS